MQAAARGPEFFSSCLTCKSREAGFFCDLDTPALATLDGLAFMNIYPKGTILFSAGEAVRGVFLICRGRVKLTVSSSNHRTVISAIARAGDILGLSSIFTGSAYKSTAETIERTQANFFRLDDLATFVLQHHEVCMKAALILSRECEGFCDHVRTLGLAHSAGEKLASLLLTWATEQAESSEAADPIRVPMTQEEISQLIGTSRETVTRCMKVLREKAIIDVHGSALTILDKPALEAIGRGRCA